MNSMVKNAIRNITFTIPASAKDWLVVLGIVCGIVGPILAGLWTAYTSLADINRTTYNHLSDSQDEMKAQIVRVGNKVAEMDVTLQVVEERSKTSASMILKFIGKNDQANAVPDEWGKWSTR